MPGATRHAGCRLASGMATMCYRAVDRHQPRVMPTCGKAVCAVIGLAAGAERGGCRQSKGGRPHAARRPDAWGCACAVSDRAAAVSGARPGHVRGWLGRFFVHRREQALRELQMLLWPLKHSQRQEESVTRVCMSLPQRIARVGDRESCACLRSKQAAEGVSSAVAASTPGRRAPAPPTVR